MGQAAEVSTGKENSVLAAEIQAKAKTLRDLVRMIEMTFELISAREEAVDQYDADYKNVDSAIKPVAKIKTMLAEVEALSLFTPEGVAQADTKELEKLLTRLSTIA